jgi:hypothetical protein
VILLICGVYEDVTKRFRTESITKQQQQNTRWEATQRVMAAKLTTLTHKIVIQLYLVAESCTICSSHSRWPVRKLLDSPLYCYSNHKDIITSLVARFSNPGKTFEENTVYSNAFCELFDRKGYTSSSLFWSSHVEQNFHFSQLQNFVPKWHF